jgi:choline dehydrogenase-like flavoprotein
MAIRFRPDDILEFVIIGSGAAGGTVAKKPAPAAAGKGS